VWSVVKRRATALQRLDSFKLWLEAFFLNQDDLEGQSTTAPPMSTNLVAGDFPFARLFAMQLAIRSGAELGPASYQGSRFNR